MRDHGELRGHEEITLFARNPRRSHVVRVLQSAVILIRFRSVKRLLAELALYRNVFVSFSHVPVGSRLTPAAGFSYCGLHFVNTDSSPTL